ncbi:CsbD family protein [Methyloversatilis sp.]|uniref:CsbD family protein n=1 Tax=Methyloversatilis sp. TaxID=2569862 RepID=UPI0035B4ED8E
MNWDTVEGNWKQFKGTVKARWGKLTDDQLDVIAGKRMELSGRIQEAYGLTREQAERQIERFELLHK